MVYYKSKHGILYCNDVLTQLKEIPSNSVNCVITSPPYWKQRDYEHKKQIGLEDSISDYINKLLNVFDEIKRILTDDGTCWVNLYDTYEDKSLLLIPERFLIGMSERGWTVRNKIVWLKKNSKPESVEDRFTKCYENIYFFTKSDKYYFKQQLELAKYDGRKKKVIEPNPTKKYLSRNYSSTDKRVVNRWSNKLENGQLARNKRDVWIIPLSRYSNAHFAVFPVEIPKICIKAGCPKNGVVLDPFIGSGTTAIVSQHLGRKWIGIELNEDYCKMIVNRLSKLGSRLI